ncbi:MAG: hypothetical protein H0X69_16905 [Gemmatimonadales bacterium]|nr:hypothetical protein [Gemmatimonadales bacterium]
MSDAARLVTAEQLSTYPDRPHYELVRGVPRVSEPPGGVHGRLAARVVIRYPDRPPLALADLFSAG